MIKRLVFLTLILLLGGVIVLFKQLPEPSLEIQTITFQGYVPQEDLAAEHVYLLATKLSGWGNETDNAEILLFATILMLASDAKEQGYLFELTEACVEAAGQYRVEPDGIPQL